MSQEEKILDIDVIKANFANREWRLDNLYHIRDSSGRKIPFVMNPVQRYLHANLHYRNIIPKARKLGISTFFSILNLDQVLWSENKTAGVIAHRQEDVKRLFRDNIEFAFENLHPWLKQRLGKPTTDTANELRFKNGGTIFTALTTRGQTPQFLHISELGYIDRHSPDKSKEIISGAINSVAMGAGNIVSIESTADNGRNGNFYELCMRAQQLRLGKMQLTDLDWKIFFLAWWQDPQYQLRNADQVVITAEMKDYFDRLRQEGITLTLPQMRWYVKAKETNRDEMFSQFPSTLTEAFSVNLEGAYYGKEVTSVYGENRAAFFPIDPTYPVNTAWDLGMNDSTVIIFFQAIGPEIRFVDYYESSGMGLQHYANILREKGYRYGTHIFPHDVNVRDLSTGVSRLIMLGELGLTDIRVAPKIFIADGIEKVRMLFNRFRFDKIKTQPVLDALQTYRKEWDDAKGTWSGAPFHGPESHIADAIRTMAVVWSEGMSGSLVDEWGDPVKSDIRIESGFFAG